MTSIDTTSHDHLLRSNGVTLSAPQRRRLDWLVDRLGPAIIHQGSTHGTKHRGVVIVVEPLSGAGAELLYRSLNTDSAVVIPFGENPAFDFLKSKLTDFGTIGPSLDGPHELWWGGHKWRALSTDRFRSDVPLRVVSCYASTLGAGHAEKLADALTGFGMAFTIESVEGDTVSAAQKADFIRRMWQQHLEPLLFVDADAVMTEPPLLPANLGCDFAVHKWNRWEMSARTLYFGRTKAAETLLQNWHHIAHAYPSVWDGYLIDQAWSLTSSQLALETVWLPRSYHAPSEDLGTPRHTTIVHAVADTADLGPDLDFAIAMRGPRRASRSGGRDAMIVVKSNTPSTDAVTVILRDVTSSDAREIAASIEAVTGAFASDSGGFGQLELSLCPWQDDIRAAKAAATSANNRVLEIAPWQSLPRDLFRAFAHSEAAGSVVVMTGRG